MKPFLSDKDTLISKIFLERKDRVITDDQELGNTNNGFLENSANDLEIKKYERSLDIVLNSTFSDSIDEI